MLILLYKKNENDIHCCHQTIHFDLFTTQFLSYHSSCSSSNFRKKCVKRPLGSYTFCLSLIVSKLFLNHFNCKHVLITCSFHVFLIKSMLNYLSDLLKISHASFRFMPFFLLLLINAELFGHTLPIAKHDLM